MIPAGGFLAIAPVGGTAPIYPLSATVVLSYHEGILTFTPATQTPPFEVIYESSGAFTAEILAGSNGLQFGSRVELRRNSVYGTLLVDSILLEVRNFQIDIEHCPDTTVSFDEVSTAVFSTEETCPLPQGFVDDTSVTVLVTEE